MKDLSPREIITYTSLVLSAILYGLILFFNYLLALKLAWYLLLIIPITIFISAYIIFGFFIENFIYKKIKVIYKNINDLKAGKGSRNINVDFSADIFGRVDSEVKEWAATKAQEIEVLKKAEQYRKEFVGNVSHELKTPIFAIQGYIETLLDGALEDEKINRNYLFKAAQNVERLQTIIDDLETISKLESNALPIHFDRFDIIELIKEVFEGLEMQAEIRNITLLFKQGHDKPTFVSADRERIRQVLTNLLSNSIKYGKEGGKTAVGIYDMDENFLVEVSDDGIGIEKEHLPRLFERFYRIDKHRSRDMGGSGIGLAIVKHIIEAHHQTINVRSTVGVGTTFGFTIKKAK
jgi:two-component system, OmpR family, phosphate regulon sensor histidine kinase PhoR